MMPKMRWVKVLIRDARPESLITPPGDFPMAVQDKAMREVLKEHPKHYTDGNEGDGPEKVM